jgi:hypothetical protein
VVKNEHDVAWLRAVQSNQAFDNQLRAFYAAINHQQEAAWLTAVYVNQLASFYQAINEAQQQAAAASAAAAAASADSAPAPGPTYSAPAPAPTYSAPAPAPAPASSGGSWSGPWSCIAQHESGGNASTDTGNGYYGGLQISPQTWAANGGVGNPADASIAEQEAVANQILATQGWSAWPNTSAACGL